MQMLGRAGRPQFDTAGVAVIMTKNANKDKYERMIAGTELIESWWAKSISINAWLH